MMNNKTLVLAPLAGQVVPLNAVPDPVFAKAMVGPGVAIEPHGRQGNVIDVVSPIAGSVGALHPHAFAIKGVAAEVLVHLGLDTATLQGEPFEIQVGQGQDLQVGEWVVRWHVDRIGALSAVTPVVALGATDVNILVKSGDEIAPGEPLFEISTV